jgi:hypothetical protein
MNARWARAILALLVLFPVSGCESWRRDTIWRSAESLGLEAPKWRPGECWRYDDGYGLQVIAGLLEEEWANLDRQGRGETQGLRAKGTTVFQRIDDPRQWQIRKGLFIEASRSDSAYRLTMLRSADPAEIFTLPPRTPVILRHEYRRLPLSGESGSQRQIRHNQSWVVEGKAKVSVPAGSFETWVIVMRVRSVDGGYTGWERWWYSPEAKMPVRMEYEYNAETMGGRRDAGERNLVRFGLADSVTGTIRPCGP